MLLAIYIILVGVVVGYLFVQLCRRNWQIPASIVVVAMILAMFVFLPTALGEEDEHVFVGKPYGRVAVVKSIDEEKDIVTFVDGVGFEWRWGGVEDWEVGNAAALVLDDMGTESIFDDTITSATYSCFTVEAP